MLKNKSLLKINYSNKAYQNLENVSLDVDELTNFIRTELLEKTVELATAIKILSGFYALDTHIAFRHAHINFGRRYFS